MGLHSCGVDASPSGVRRGGGCLKSTRGLSHNRSDHGDILIYYNRRRFCGRNRLQAGHFTRVCRVASSRSARCPTVLLCSATIEIRTEGQLYNAYCLLCKCLQRRCINYTSHEGEVVLQVGQRLFNSTSLHVTILLERLWNNNNGHGLV